MGIFRRFSVYFLVKIRKIFSSSVNFTSIFNKKKSNNKKTKKTKRQRKKKEKYSDEARGAYDLLFHRAKLRIPAKLAFPRKLQSGAIRDLDGQS